MKLDTNIFIERANAIHNNKYNYTETIYVNMKSKVKIICPVHGAFEQTPDKHLHGKCGCPLCSGNVRGSKKSFVERAIIVHGDLYDYSSVDYINNKKPVKIICKIHGEFLQSPTNHLSGKGCPYCSNNVPSTTEQFIKKAKKIHGTQYLYDKVAYTGNRNLVTIRCPKHGLFTQRPYAHLLGAGCPECGHLKQAEHHDYKASYEKSVSTFLEKYGVENPMYSADVKSRHKAIVSSADVNLRRIKTKRENGSFNTSLSEYRLYNMLTDYFGEDDVLTNHKTPEYPYMCDYYIKSRNMYIELNAHWSHGGHWYNPNKDSIRIADWNSRSKYYHNAAVTFSERDVAKRNCARDHSLNYIVFWKNDLSDAREWFQCNCPDGIDWLNEYSWK